MWPWRPAAEHLAALTLLSLVLVEIALGGEKRIPFTCAYRPGRSRVHIAICVAIVIVLPATIWAATLERDALENPALFIAILAVLGLVWIGARSWNAWLRSTSGTQPAFDDEPADRLAALELWDSRVTSRGRPAA
jgi:hypothetical protein